MTSNEPGDRPDLLESVVARIEEDIVFGRCHPRERLVEADLAEAFAVKRSVVREALAALEKMGLVERRRNRGAVVRAFTARDAEQLYAVRATLEDLAARSIPLSGDAAVVARLEDIQRRHDIGCETGDLRTVFRVNVEFHRALFAACGNPYLVEAVDAFAQKSHAIRSFSMTDPAYLAATRLDHWAMIEALAAGDRKRLATLCSVHTERSKNGYVRAWRERFAWHDGAGATTEGDDNGG